MSATRPRTRDRAATEARILAAAHTLFSRSGYERVTVRAIAREAAANPALISRYFGSKERLFGAVVAAAFHLERLLDGDLAGLPDRLAGFALRPRGTADEALLDALHRAERLPGLREEVDRRLRVRFVEPLAALLRSGDQADRLARALTVTALLSGVRTVRRRSGLTGAVVAPAGGPTGEPGEPAGLHDVLAATFAAALGLPPGR